MKSTHRKDISKDASLGSYLGIIIALLPRNSYFLLLHNFIPLRFLIFQFYASVVCIWSGTPT